MLLAAFRAAVSSFDLAARVRAALSGQDARRVLAVGKAAPAMLAGVQRPGQEVLLIVPEGTAITWVAPSTRVLFADHPLPSERSLAAAEAAFEFVERGDTVALISGGTSSLLCAPLEGVSLAQKQSLHAALLGSGAPIREINLVRRHISRIKGGGLARRARGRLITVLASDVIDGAPHEIGSGPTLVDPTTVAQARAVLDRHQLSAELTETLKPTDARASALEAELVARPEDLSAAVARELEGHGFTVFELPPSQDDAGSLAQAYAGLASSLNSGQALVRVAEPTLRLGPRVGKGGRSTHLAALAAPLLPEDVTLLCAASDGVDGRSGAIGAIVSRQALARYDVSAAVAAFDTAALHRAAGTLIESRGPSGLNLCDLHIVARS